MQQETAVGHQTPFNPANLKLAMWLFLASEVMFFTVLIAAFIWARFTYPEAHALLNVPLTSLNTFLLLTSSFTVVRALAAIQSGNQIRFQRSLAMTGALGTLFFLIMMLEYTKLSQEGLTLSSGGFGFAFFTLTGFHGMHVLIGLGWLLVNFGKALNNGFSAERHFAIEFFGLYWHFVDVVWIFIFTLVYLI